MGPKAKIVLAVGASVVAVIVILASIHIGGTSPKKVVPHEGAWGIYSLDISSEKVHLIYSSENMLRDLSLDSAGQTIAFSERLGGTGDTSEEICTINVSGAGFNRLTNNSVLDTYPAWSSDGSVLYFLSWRNATLDIYRMSPDGSGQVMFYDSGFHDADIHCAGDTVAFTRQSQIWSIGDDGTGEERITNSPRAGQWGNANLPFGDYDPRLSPDGSRIVFERLVDDASVHGNYDLYVTAVDGTGESALTDNGYSQGMASWSHLGDRIAYIVAAINDAGVYHIHTMNSDGTDNRDITPSFFPPGFLCHSVVFSNDDSKLFFIAQWW